MMINAAYDRASLHCGMHTKAITIGQLMSWSRLVQVQRLLSHTCFVNVVCSPCQRFTWHGCLYQGLSMIHLRDVVSKTQQQPLSTAAVGLLMGILLGLPTSIFTIPYTTVDTVIEGYDFYNSWSQPSFRDECLFLCAVQLLLFTWMPVVAVVGGMYVMNEYDALKMFYVQGSICCFLVMILLVLCWQISNSDDLHTQLQWTGGKIRWHAKTFLGSVYLSLSTVIALLSSVYEFWQVISSIHTKIYTVQCALYFYQFCPYKEMIALLHFWFCVDIMMTFDQICMVSICLSADWIFGKNSSSQNYLAGAVLFNSHVI